MDERPLASPAEPLARSSWLTYAQAAERLGMTAEAVRHRARRAGWRSMPGNDGRTLILLPDDVALVRAPGHTAMRAQAAEDVETSARAHGRAERAFTTALSALREAHAAEVERLTGAKDSEIARLAAQVDVLIRQSEGQRVEIAAIEAKRLRAEEAVSRADAAEKTAEAERARADGIADRAHALEAELAEIEAVRDVERTRAHEAEEGREAARLQVEELRIRLAEVEAEGHSQTVEAAELAAKVRAAETAQAEAEAHAAELRQVDKERRGKGRWARLRSAWRGA